ncbi:hypothetical protein HN011_002349 [Eciton burchellii]|nr:hypothetical protein HN011_002349 [Eciton burchellii]
MRRRNIKRRRLKRQEMRGGKEEETRSDCGKAPEEQRSVTPLRSSADLDAVPVGGGGKRWYKGFCFSIRKTDPSSLFFVFEHRSSNSKPSDMFKLCILAVILAAACAAPAPAPGAVFAAPAAIAAVPAPIVTASSSQVVARNYNTLAAAPLAAAAAAAPLAVAAPLTAAAPVAAAAPFAYAAAPLAAYGTHAVAPAAYAAYSAPVLL